MIESLRKKTYLLIFLLLSACLAGCVSRAPLPENITFNEPSPDISPGLSALVGTWEGKWYESQAITLVIENVDGVYVDLIFSVGTHTDGGINPQNTFYYVSGKVISDTAFGWSTANNKFIFEMQEGFQELKGYFIAGSTGEKINVTLFRSSAEGLPNVTVHKCPYVKYTHPEKSSEEFEHDNDLCLEKARKQTAFLSLDMRRYAMCREVDRCLRDDFGWKTEK